MNIKTSNINAFCENKGWLFEDLKSEFQRAGLHVSDELDPASDAYICIRSSELPLISRLDRTVIQVHDVNPPKNMHLCNASCGLSFMHPIQAWYWRGAGYKGPFIIQPIGARDSIDVPTRMPHRPTVGFFCSETRLYTKDSPKFAKAVQLARQVMPFDCLIIGRNLDHIAKLGTYEQRAAGPEDYARIDLLACTSQSPAVPLSFYEAMAAGKPVVSTPRWIPGDHIPAVHFGNTAEELAWHICEVLKKRELNFRYRRKLRWRKFLLSDWLSINIEFTKKAVKNYYDRL